MGRATTPQPRRTPPEVLCLCLEKSEPCPIQGSLTLYQAYQHIPELLDLIGIWGIWRERQLLELSVTFLGPFLNNFRGMAWGIVRLGGAIIIIGCHCHGLFGWLHVKWHPHECQDQRSPSFDEDAVVSFLLLLWRISVLELRGT